jgi:hypothetical protein
MKATAAAAAAVLLQVSYSVVSLHMPLPAAVDYRLLAVSAAAAA